MTPHRVASRPCAQLGAQEVVVVVRRRRRTPKNGSDSPNVHTATVSRVRLMPRCSVVTVLAMMITSLRLPQLVVAAQPLREPAP